LAWSRLRSSWISFSNFGGRRDRSGRRLCYSCSPTASQIDQLILRSIFWLLFVAWQIIKGSASIPLLSLLGDQVGNGEIVSASGLESLRFAENRMNTDLL